MIYLVRHGETEWNVAGRIQGRKDSALTPRGVRQIAAMADLLHDLIARDPPAPWRLVASPAIRTRTTAAAISDRLGLPTAFDDRLLEISCGDWEGQLRGEIAGQHPDRFASREWFFGAPGGETFEDVEARARGWLTELPPEDERHVIAVSHGITGRMLRGVYGGLDRQAILDQDVPQDAIYRLAGGEIHRLDCEPVD